MYIQDYWSQYENIFQALLELSGLSLLVGFIISFVFLFGKFYFEKRHTLSRIITGSLLGALLIVGTMILSLVAVVGISILCGVSLTGFSNMSFVLSVGFAVEYSVHIVARFLRADMAHKTGLDRIKYTSTLSLLLTVKMISDSLKLRSTHVYFNWTPSLNYNSVILDDTNIYELYFVDDWCGLLGVHRL
jgi:hypothetical protein